MNQLLTFSLALIGIACIFAGYHLFCGLPSLKRRTSRTGLFLFNLLPGALLAIFGMGLATTEVHAFLTPRSAFHRHAVPVEGTSFHAPLRHISPLSTQRAG